jgi:hypothetical protein
MVSAFARTGESPVPTRPKPVPPAATPGSPRSAKMLTEYIRAGTPGTVGGAIGAGDHDGVSVGIAYPALPMVGAAVVVIRRIAVTRKNDLDLHFRGALHGSVEVVYFEPEQHSVAVGFVGGIGDGAVVVFDIEAMQLKDEHAVFYELLVVRAAVSAATTEQSLIPATAGLDICDANKRLRAHRLLRVAGFGERIDPSPRKKRSAQDDGSC